MEPGLTSMPWWLAIMIAPVSVCHHVSWNGEPNRCAPHSTPWGFSGSPTLASSRGGRGIDGAWPPPASHFMSIRMAVGAVYQTSTA